MLSIHQDTRILIVSYFQIWKRNNGSILMGIITNTYLNSSKTLQDVDNMFLSYGLRKTISELRYHQTSLSKNTKQFDWKKYDRTTCIWYYTKNVLTANEESWLNFERKWVGINLTQFATSHLAVSKLILYVYLYDAKFIFWMYVYTTEVVRRLKTIWNDYFKNYVETQPMRYNNNLHIVNENWLNNMKLI